MQFSALIFLLSASIVHGAVLSLTHENFAEKTAGKTVFIKFFAPWCGHCQAMASDWEKLAEDWKDHPIGLIAEVDCTVEEELCEEFDVSGYPALFYGEPTAPESYDGDREYDALSEFAKEHLSKRMCSVYATETCSEEEKAIIAGFDSRSLKDLSDAMEEVEKSAEAEEEAFSELAAALKEKYEELVDAYNLKVEELRAASNYNLLRAMVNKKEDDSKGEL